MWRWACTHHPQPPSCRPTYNTAGGRTTYGTVCAVLPCRGVKSLASTQGVVYATGASCQIVALDVQDGEVQHKFDASKYPITCLAVMPGTAHSAPCSGMTRRPAVPCHACGGERCWGAPAAGAGCPTHRPAGRVLLYTACPDANAPCLSLSDHHHHRRRCLQTGSTRLAAAPACSCGTCPARSGRQSTLAIR